MILFLFCRTVKNTRGLGVKYGFNHIWSTIFIAELSHAGVPLDTVHFPDSSGPINRSRFVCMWLISCCRFDGFFFGRMSTVVCSSIPDGATPATLLDLTMKLQALLMVKWEDARRLNVVNLGCHLCEVGVRSMCWADENVILCLFVQSAKAEIAASKHGFDLAEYFVFLCIVPPREVAAGLLFVVLIGVLCVGSKGTGPGWSKSHSSWRYGHRCWQNHLHAVDEGCQFEGCAG